MKRFFILILMGLIILTGVLPGAAQEGSDRQPTLLVTALDDAGVEQAYRVDVPGGDYEQLTNAEFSVEAFDVSENVLAYVSGELLFIEHPRGTIIQKLSRLQELLVTVHISPDEREVSYNDDIGLYFLNVESGEAELLLEHKDFTDPTNPNGVGDGRYYFEAEFIEDSDNLIIGVGLWEGRTTGVYNVSDGTLTELLNGWTDPDVDLQIFYHLLPLDDEQVLLANNNDVRGCFPCGLWYASSIDDIQDYELLFANKELAIDAEDIATGISAARETTEGEIILFVKYRYLNDKGALEFGEQILQLDMETNELTPIIVELDDDMRLDQPQISPDGIYLASVGSPLGDGYTGYGSPVIYDLESSTQIDVDFPMQISSIRWSD
jgi:hypothetical protein